MRFASASLWLSAHLGNTNAIRPGGSRRGRRIEQPCRYQAERLEQRLLLSGSVATVSVGTTPGPSTLSLSPVASGTQITVTAVVNPGTGVGITPSGTFSFQWYGGNSIGTFSLRQQDNIHTAFLDSTPLTLDVKDVGPAITSGPYQGDYILGEYYSGDGNFAPSHVIDSTDFANVSSPNFNGVLNAVFVKLTGVSTKNTLAFIHTPDNAATDKVFNPPVTIQLLDNKGRPITNATDPISLSLTGGDPTATLSGTRTVNAVSGVATFGDLSVDKPGNYQVIASSGSLDPVFSSPFKITDATLKFIKSPKDGDAGAALAPIVVALQDAKGHTITADSSTIVTLTPVGFSGDATITGNQATLVNGVATFSQVVLKEDGVYQLQASDGTDTAATSGKFKVAGLHVVFIKQPADADAGAPLMLKVGLADSKNRIVTTENARSILVSMNTITGGVNAALEGNTNIVLQNGLVVFDDSDPISITETGTFTLTAVELDTDDTPVDTTASVTSKPFKVGGDHVVFVKQPANTDVNAPLIFRIALANARNKIVTTENTRSLFVTMQTVSGGTNAVLAGKTNILMQNGVVQFDARDPISINKPGSYTLTATELDADGSPVDTTVSGISKTFQITGNHVAFIKQPANADINAPLFVALALENSKNKIVRTDDANSLALSLNIISGGTNVVVAGHDNVGLQDGMVAFNATDPMISINKIGTYTLTATELDPSLADIDTTLPATSKPFKVEGLHVVFRKQPASTDVKAPLVFTVALENSKNKIVTTDDANTLVVTAASGGTEVEMAGHNADVLQSGTVVFDATDPLSISQVGTYTLTASELDPSHEVIDTTLAATSKPFKVEGLHVVFRKQPASTDVNAPIILTLALENSKNKIVTTDDANSLALSLNIVSGGTNAVVAGHDNVGLQNGMVVFNATDPMISINKIGTYTLTATELDPSLADIDTTLPATSKPFNVDGLHVAFLKQPANTTVNAQLFFTLALEDSKNRIVKTDDANSLLVVLNIDSGGTGAILTGEENVLMQNGMVVYDGTDPKLSINAAGTYSLTASELGTGNTDIDTTESNTSKVFKVLG